MTDVNKAGGLTPDEQQQQRAERVESERRIYIYRRQLDENGISIAMVDTMLAVVAEGLTTGSTDLRSLLYCAYREAQKVQKEWKGYA